MAAQGFRSRFTRQLLFIICMIGLFIVSTMTVLAEVKSDQDQLQETSTTPSVRNRTRRPRNTQLQSSSSTVQATFAPGGITTCGEASIYDPDYEYFSRRGIYAPGYQSNRYVLGLIGDFFTDETLISFWAVSDENGVVHIPVEEAVLLTDDPSYLYTIMLVGVRRVEYEGDYVWATHGACEGLFNRLSGDEIFNIYDAYFNDPLTSPEASTSSPNLNDFTNLEAFDFPDIETNPTADYSNEGTLTFGTPIYNTLSTTYGDLFYFEGYAGDILSATLVSTDFDSYLDLWHNDTVIAYDDDSAGDLDSAIEIELPSSGTYILNPRSFQNAGTGDYVLTATLNNGAVGSANPSSSVTSLNYSLPPVYGSTSLISGFVPDPFTQFITSGGTINASSVSADCWGYTTAEPSFSVHYQSGSFSTLRFYFVSSGDTTMIINTATGSWLCDDDSFETLSPTIDVSNPTSGRYDIWIGSYSADVYHDGTLNITEITSNHP